MIQFAAEPGGRKAFEAVLNDLLISDWETGTGPMRLGSDLILSDMADAPFFQNARLLLAALNLENGTPATATGNLGRAFVRQMFDRLILPREVRERTLCCNKVLNEQDVWRLHIVRIVSECAGLVAHRKKRFHITKGGCALLPDAQAGPLFRKLFIAHFRKFDLGYNFHLRQVPGIQQSMPVLLWRLDTVACDWTAVQGLAPKVLLPAVFSQLHAAMRSPYDAEEWILAGYFLDPLLELGLIEKKSHGEWSGITERDEIRTSALWRKFMSFEPWSGDPR